MNTASFPHKPPAPGTAGEYRFPAFTEDRLDNGLRVLVCQDRRVARVCATLLITTGLTPDEQRLPGLSKFLAEMLKEGTSTRTADEIAEAIDFMGAELETIGSQDMADGLGLLGELVLDATLPDDELERLRRRELAALANKHSQPGYLGRKACYRALFGEHPYAAIDATEESLTAVSRGDLTEFRGAQFDPARAHLIIVGSVGRNEAVRMAESVFGGWQAPEPTESLTAQAPPSAGRRALIIDFPNAVQSNILIANHAVPFGHPDFIPFKVMNQVLGGSYASRLFMNLREEKGYTYGAYSRPDARVEAGCLVSWAAVGKDVTDGALTEFFHELNRIRDERVGDEELKSVQSFLTGIFPIALERIEQIAAHIVSLKLYGLPRDHWDTYRDRINAATPEQVQQMARQYVRPDEALIVVVGRADELRPLLEPYGPVTVLDKTGAPVT